MANLCCACAVDFPAARGKRKRALSDTDLQAPPGGLQFSTLDGRDPAVVAEADRNARHWTADTAGPLPIGSEIHKQATARMFRDTFNPYKPFIIDWPKLDDAARDRLVNLPIWDIAVQTEGKARLRMLSYARSLADPRLARGDRAEWLGRRAAQGWCCPIWSKPMASSSTPSPNTTSRATRNGPIW